MKILVNLITTSRFIYTIILPFLQMKISNVSFVINLIILFLTDTIDGFLARKFKVQTMYGSIMDTVADKTLSIALLIILIKHIKILLIVLVCELMISIINIIGMFTGRKTKSSIFGKIKMWFLAISIVLGCINYFGIIEYDILFEVCCITIIMQVITFIGYVKYLSAQEPNSKIRHKIKNLSDVKYVLFNTEYYLKNI